jgi:hypothetical protein
MTEKTVTYCEYLFMGNPIEIQLPLKEAMKRYDAKIKALKQYPLMEAGSFVGIKDKNKWIISNTETKLKEAMA